MKLIGAYYPGLPVNAFLMPVLEAEDGRLLTQLADRGRITEFVELPETTFLDLNEGWSNALENIPGIMPLEEGQVVPVREDRPLYCYFKEEGWTYPLRVGEKNELEEILLPLLFEEELNVNAKIIIADFFDLNNLVALLVEKGNRLFKEKQSNMLLKKEYLLSTQEATEEVLRQAPGFFTEAADFLRRNSQFNWKSFLLFFNDHIHFAEYYFSCENFPHVVPNQYVSAVKAALRDIIVQQLDASQVPQFEHPLGPVYQTLEEKESKAELSGHFLSMAAMIKRNRKRLSFP